VVLPVVLLLGFELSLWWGFPTVSERFCHWQAVVCVPRRKGRIVLGIVGLSS
jgi:hypothetical protein